MIIIALGESIASLGISAGALRVRGQLIVGALLAMASAAAMWWAYFDVVAIAAEQRLRAAAPAEQPRLARDSYTYLHLPMIAGIVLFAVAVKKTLRATAHRLQPVSALALSGGVALYLYLIALSAFRWRTFGAFNRGRLVAAAVLLALTPASTALPALLSLALVAAIVCALIAYERLRHTEARNRIRHHA